MSHACPDTETLFYYTEGLLDPDEHALVAAHLKTCAECRDQVSLESELSVSLRQLPMPEPSQSMASAVRARILAGGQRQRVSRWWWVVAAAFVLASGMQWLIAADLSLQGAALAIVDLLVFVVQSPVALVTWLLSPETWDTAAALVTSLAGVIASSPAMLALTVLAALAAAATANLMLFGVARKLVRT